MFHATRRNESYHILYDMPHTYCIRHVSLWTYCLVWLYFFFKPSPRPPSKRINFSFQTFLARSRVWIIISVVVSLLLSIAVSLARMLSLPFEIQVTIKRWHRRNRSPNAAHSRKQSKSRPAHKEVAAALSHKHHPISHHGAGLIQIVYASHSPLSAKLILDKILLPPMILRGFWHTLLQLID